MCIWTIRRQLQSTILLVICFYLIEFECQLFFFCPVFIVNCLEGYYVSKIQVYVGNSNVLAQLKVFIWQVSIVNCFSQSNFCFEFVKFWKLFSVRIWIVNCFTIQIFISNSFSCHAEFWLSIVSIWSNFDCHLFFLSKVECQLYFSAKVWLLIIFVCSNFDRYLFYLSEFWLPIVFFFG